MFSENVRILVASEPVFRCVASLPRRFRRLHFARPGDELLQLARQLIEALSSSSTTFPNWDLL
jgi:hypothetical protein